MSPRKKRRKFTPEAKAAILRRHLADKVPVSDLCKEYKIQPSLLYQWQRQLLDNAAAALKPPTGRPVESGSFRTASRRSRLSCSARTASSPSSDNGSAFIARDFKVFIREAGMTHVRTSPYYPQSNGKIERWQRTIKADALRRHQPSTVEGAWKVIEDFVVHYNEYNEVRLHSAIGYVTPATMLSGRESEVWSDRDRSWKLPVRHGARGVETFTFAVLLLLSERVRVR